MTGHPTHTLFLVPSANHAVQGERALLGAGIPCRLIPVPRHLSSQCGVCLSVEVADGPRAAVALRAAGTVTDGTHDVCLCARPESVGAAPPADGAAPPAVGGAASPTPET